MNRIRHIRCPVLLAHGSEDIVIPVSDMHLIREQALPGNDLRTLVFADAGQLIAFINEKLGASHA